LGHGPVAGSFGEAVGADVRQPIDTRFEDFPYSPANLAVTIIDAIRRVVP
jgi:hypothetical protein